MIMCTVMMIMVAVIVVMLVIVGMIMIMDVIMRLMLVSFVSGHVMIVMLDRLLVCPAGRLRLRVACALDHLALHAVAMTAATGIAMARTAAVAAVLVLFLGLAMGALIGLDQRLTVGDRDLIIVGMDFAEGEETVTVAAIFDEGGLQRRFYARDLGEINVAAQLLALGSLEIKLFDSVATDHDDPGLFRVGGID